MDGDKRTKSELLKELSILRKKIKNLESLEQKPTKAVKKQVAKSLNVNNDHLNMIVNKIPALISYVDINRHYRFVNQRYAENFKKPVSSFIGKSYRKIVGEKYYCTTLKYVDAAFSGQHVNYETTIQFPGTGTHWLLVTYSPDFENKGKVKGIFIAAYDITERKLAEKALEESERRYKTLFDGSPIGITISSSDGKIIEVNKARSEMTGYTIDELRTMSVYQYCVNPKKRNEMMDIFKRTGKIRDYEMQIRRKDGKIITELTNLDRIEIQGVDYLLATGRDITAHKQAEDMLQMSEMRFRSLIENSADVISLVDGKGNVLYSSPAYSRLMGYSIEERIGKNTFDLVHPHDRENLQQMLSEILRKTDLVIIPPARVKHRNGKWLWIEGTARNLLNEPGVDAIVINFRDITDRKIAEDALLVSEDKFKYIFEHSMIGKSITLPSGEVNVNKAFCDMLGYDFEELRNKKWQELTHPEDIKTTKKLIEPLLNGKMNSLRFEKRYIHKNGSIVWADVATSLRLDKDGKPLYFMTAVMDISERKLAEIEIYNFNRVYAVLSNVNQLIVRENNNQKLLDGICNIAIKDGHFRMAWLGMLDEASGNVIPVASAGAVDGYLDNISITLDDSKSGKEPTGTALRENRTVICNDIKNSECILPWRERALALGYRSSAAFPLRINDRPIGAFVVYSSEEKFFVKKEVRLIEELAMDISFALETMDVVAKRKKAEESLRQSEDKFRNVIETALEGVWFLNADLITTEVNNAIVQMLGYSSEELIGKPFIDIVCDEDRLAQMREFEQRKQGMDGHYERRVRCKDGSIKWLYLSSKARLDSNGKFVGAFAMITDITERKNMEEALKQSKEDYKRLFEEHSAVKLLIDPDTGSILDANYAAAQYYGWTREELKQMKIYQINTSSAEEIRNEMERARVNKKNHFDFRHRRADGSIRDVEVFSSKIQMMGKEVLHSIVQDVTERRLAERALRESEADLIEAQRVAKIGNWTLDIETQEIKWSDELLRIFDVKKESFSGRYDFFINCIHHEDKQKVLETNQKAKEIGEPFQIGYRIITSGKQLKYINEIGYARRSATGKIIGLFGTGQDVTEQKQAQDKIKQSESRFSAVFHASPAPIGITRLSDNTFIEVNEAWQDVTGYSGLEVIGHSADEFNLWTSSEQRVELIKELRENGHVRGDVQIRTKSGELRDLLFSAELFELSGEQYMISIAQDITDQKKLQRELLQVQKMDSIGTLAGGVAHDFNNILGIILAYSSSIDRQIEDKEKIIEYGKIITQAVNRGASIVRQILTFARQTDVNISLMNPTELIHELLSMLKQTFPKIIIFVEDIEEGIPFINADRTQVYQAFLNLCVNARDAMPNGGTLTIRVKKQTKDQVKEKFSIANQDNYLLVSVSDTGVGMDEKTRLKIFDPFFTTKEKGKGTGLGLAVVYGVVHSHSGYIDVESSLNHGTTFNLYFPCPENRKILEYIPLKSETYDKGGTETILFVEDEEVLTEMVCFLLESKGYKVYRAKDGIDAIKEYENHKHEIDVVITDMGLPGMLGSEVFEELRKLNPNVRVILASGFFEPNIKSELLKDGVKEFIQKPYSPDEMLRKLREVLDIK